MCSAWPFILHGGWGNDVNDVNRFWIDEPTSRSIINPPVAMSLESIITPESGLGKLRSSQSLLSLAHDDRVPARFYEAWLLYLRAKLGDRTVPENVMLHASYRRVV